MVTKEAPDSSILQKQADSYPPSMGLIFAFALFRWREQTFEEFFSLQLIQYAVIDHLRSDLVNVDVLQAGETQDGGHDPRIDSRHGL